MLETNGDIYFEVLSALQWKSASYWQPNKICHLFNEYFFLAIVACNNLLSVFGIVVFSYILFCYSSKRYRTSHLAPDQQLIITLSSGVLISSVIAGITGRVFVYSQQYVSDHFHADKADLEKQALHGSVVNFILALNGNIRIFYCDSMYYFLLLLLAVYRYSFNLGSSYCYNLFSEWKSMRYFSIFILCGVFTVVVAMLFQFIPMGDAARYKYQ